jgi:hypothetical protein
MHLQFLQGIIGFDDEDDDEEEEFGEDDEEEDDEGEEEEVRREHLRHTHTSSPAVPPPFAP